jgi:nucleoside phosphorylase
MPRALRLLVIGLFLASTFVGVSGAAKAATPPCESRLLVLSAMPVEIDPLIAAAKLDLERTVVVHDRKFYVGTLQGNDVILALTGIGILNAEQATTDAFATFRCGDESAIKGVVFSGVAGGDWIGDVAVPTTWTEDGKTFYGADKTMLKTAQLVARRGSAKLTPDVGAGDPACVCTDPHAVEPVTLAHKPELLIGGKGISSDPFNGRQLPCFPEGGDVFGCEPCKLRTTEPPNLAGFADGIRPFLDPGFFTGYFAAPPAADPSYKSQDMESAAVGRVTKANHRPFIIFRGVSDGQGDPLMLPGFPFQFFAYRQIAADNAAIATLAFLQEWSVHH